MADDQDAGNPFAQIDPQMGSSGGQSPTEENPFSTLFPAGVQPEKVSGLSSFFSSAARSALPAAGGLVAAGAGAEVGAAIGAFGGPLAPVTVPVGGIIGGLAGFFAGSAATEGAQDWALKQAPDNWQETLGQSERQQRLQEEQHPYYSFLGGIAPYALTMSPGKFTTKALNLPEGATTFQKLMANPVTARAFGGAAMGGMELGQEAYNGESPDWAKVGISTGFGMVFNKPTKFGEYLHTMGASPFHAGAPEPTVAQAADLGVMGPGITESTFHGGQEQSDATRTTAHNLAADEEVALNEPAAPDLHVVARRLDPETFQQNDELLARRDSLRQFIDQQSNPPQEAFDDLNSKQSMLEEALRVSNPRSPDARNYRAQLADVEAQRKDLTTRQEAWANGTHVDTPEIMLARQHLMDTEHELWDLAPHISAAMRRAADHAGQFEEEAAAPAAEPAAAEQIAEPAQPEAGAPKTPEAQRAFITADRTSQLMATGMPREQAEANAHVEAAYYETLAARFRGKLGTAEDLYRERAAKVVGPQGQTAAAPPQPPAAPAAPAAEPAPTGPAPRPRLRTAEQIAKDEKIPATKANGGKIQDIQNQELIALADWQANERASQRPARAPRVLEPAGGPSEAERLGQSYGVDTAEKTPEQIVEEVAERAPVKMLERERDSQVEAYETLLDAADKETGVEPEELTGVGEEGAAAGEQPGAAGQHEEPVSEGGGAREPGAEPAERNPEEVGSGDVAAGDAGPEPAGSAAEPEPARVEPEPPTSGMSLVETRHTKTGEPLYVVAMSDRVSSEDFNGMKGVAKQNGGYYSSFRGRGAIPGWTFKTREGAQAFMRAHEVTAPAEQVATPAVRRPTPKSFWSYQAETPPGPPSHITLDDWEKLSPGMRRELFRSQPDLWKTDQTAAEVTEQAGGRAPAETADDIRTVQQIMGQDGMTEAEAMTAQQLEINRFLTYKDADRDMVGIGQRGLIDLAAGHMARGDLPTAAEWARRTGASEEYISNIIFKEARKQVAEAQTVADAVAPAQGRGPLPVTAEAKFERAEPKIEEPKPEVTPAPKPETGEAYGSTNKIFTADKAEAARARMRDRLSRLNSGFDPEMMLDGLTLAGYHIEAGARSFAAYSRAMVDDLGEKIRPFLEHFYNSVRDYPGFDKSGMDSRADVEEHASREATTRTPDQWQESDQDRADIDQLLDSHRDDPLIQDIARMTAEGQSPEDIEASHVGDRYSLDEIEAIARAQDRRGEIPAANEDEDGVQGTLPLRDAGAGAEDVHGTEAVWETGGIPSGEGDGGEPDAAGASGAQAEERVRQLQAIGPEGSRGNGAGASDRVPEAGSRAEPGAAGRPAAQPDADVQGNNFSIQPGDLAESRGPRAKARDNVAAIELAKRLIEEGRPATKAEQAILVKYTGWGGLKGAFEDSAGEMREGFKDVGAKLKTLLTEEEYKTAERSTQYAHYTAEHVIRSMWDAVRRMGFEGGSVFEPGMGVGHFLGLMPPDLAGKSRYQGIEMDHLTADIAKLLYPESGVRQADFTKSALPERAFDLVIGNPPFSDTVISSDPKYRARGFMLHDYFFAKSLDAVRPGGLLGFVTSAGTMNKLDSAAREYLAERAEFAGGVRLPSSAFRQNAGTEVTTDILFFKRHPEGRVEIGEEKPDWTQVAPRSLLNADGETIEGNVNKYFSDHPENVLGEEGFFDKLYKDRYAVHPTPGADLAADLQSAIGRLPANIMEPEQTPEQRAALDFSSKERKDGSFYIHDDGTLMQYRDGAGQPVPKRGAGSGGFTAGEIERIQHLIPMRDSLRDVFSADLARDDEAGVAARATLNEHYDRFVEKFGPVNKATFRYQRPSATQMETLRAEAREEVRAAGGNFDEGDFDASDMIAAKAKISDIAKARQAAREDAANAGRTFNEGTFDPAEVQDNVYETRPNIKPFMSDQESYRLRSIEQYNDTTGESSKKDIFYKSILKFEQEPEIRSANDGVLWSMNRFGRFDVDQIAQKMGRSRSDIVAELGDAVFKVPGTNDTFQTRDEYLSGDIVSKLETARAEAVTDPDVRRNLPALEAALPPPLPPSAISMNIGMPWIPVETIKEFVRDHLQLGDPYIKHSQETGTWLIKGNGQGSAPGVPQWGMAQRDAFELLADAMNRTPPRIYVDGRGPDGKKTRVFDATLTQAAQDKVDRIKEGFQDWLRAEPARADALASRYNDTMNRSVLRQYDGSYLTTPGVAADWSWRPHQQRVVARIIQDGNTYMAHSVGAGKTSAMIGAGMEMRRLGLVKKPVYVVPNHMLGQFTKEFYEQYPTARISVADEDRFHTDRRKQFVANVAQDDIDAVIMTHSSFGKIPISDEFQGHLIQEQMDMLDKAMGDLDPKSDRIAVGRLQNQKEKLEQKLSGQAGGAKDQTLTFEQMGGDFLFVEAHLFRKLGFATKQSGLKGITPEGSNMAFDLYSKVRYLDGQKPGRSAVFASGTPVTNTMGELYSLSRFMQPEALAERGLTHFDSWAQNFGDTKTGLEENAAGGYQPVTRFGQFVNLPELYKMVGQVMDIVTPKQLEQYVTRPAIKGGERQFHLAPRTDILDSYQEELRQRMEAIKNRKGPPQKGDDILLSVINDGRHSAIDPRFVEETQSDPRSKLNMMIQNVARIYRDTADTQFYTPASGYKEPSFRGPATQMVFANLGVNGRGPMDFSTYQWIKEALRREGVDPDHLAFIGDYSGTLARQTLFNDMNEGKKRILVGSTQKMSTGVNAQRRLYALHNLDPLWYPADDEQRVGRALRQGNHNPEIEIHDYSTKGTYDSAMWKMMGNKARFIEQFFRGDPELRNMEDVGEASMYEQASAMATTDERMITLTEMKQDLERSRRREAAHEQEQYSLRTSLRNQGGYADMYAKDIQNIQSDIERREDTRGDKFSMLVAGEKFDKRTEASESLEKVVADRAAGLAKGGEAPVGKIGGFPMIIRRGASDDLIYNLRMAGGEKSLSSTNAAGAIASAENYLRSLEDKVDYAKQNMASAQQKAEAIKPLLGKKFEGAGDIMRLAKSVRDLEEQINPPKKEGEAETPQTPDNERELYQGAQGKIRLKDSGAVITLMRTANASTFMHETAHHWLEQMMGDSAHPAAPDELKSDADTVRRWLKLKDDGQIPTAKHEKFARTFEQYLREGVAPTKALASVFAKFKEWLTGIYQTIKGLGTPINEDIRGVFDRMLATTPERTVYAPEKESAQGLGAVHKADGAETEPHEAGAVADRMTAERNRFITEQPPEIVRELTEASATVTERAAGEAAERTGENDDGAARGGPLDAGGGQSEPVAPGGGGGAQRSDVGAGGGKAPAKGAEPSDGSDQRPSASANPGVGQFAPKPATSFADAEPKLVDKAGNIRVENLTDVADIAQAIHDAADRNDEFRAVRGGMTKGQMLELADSMGLDPSKIDEAALSRMFGGTEDLGAKILAARRLVVQSAGVVADAMKTAAESESDHDIAALGLAIARHDMIQSALSGVTAEWGRAGNAFHSLLQGWEKAKDVNQLLKDNLGRDLFQLKMISKLGKSLDTPGKVSKFLRDAQHRTFGRMVLEYWINGLISGPTTHATYMVGNAVLAAHKAGPETAAASAIGAIRARFGREGTRVRLGEVGAQFRAAVTEAPAAAQSAIEAARSGQTTLLPGENAHAMMPFQGDTGISTARNMTNAPVSWHEVAGDAYSLVQGMRDGLVAGGELIKAGGVAGAPLFGPQYSRLGQIPDIAYKGVNVLPVGTLARLPGRAIAAIHSTFRSLNYSMEINALAYRQAVEEGKAGTDLAARIADLRQNPSDAMMDQARTKATDMTLMGQGGAFVKALQKLTNVEFAGIPFLKFVDPFVAIAANIMNQSLVQRTPVGLLSKEIRADLMGKNGNVAADTAAAKMLVGTALSVAFGGLAAQGLASGSGPSDPHQSAMWRLAGNQAHSVRIGDIWYDVHKLGPVGMLMSVAADMYDVAHSIGKEDADVVGKAVMHAFTQNILDESFMRGPSDLIKALTDPDRYGASYVRTFLSSFLPYSVGMSQMARASDPYSRQARTIMDAIRAKVPGLSESLFPRRDIWGEPMAHNDALIAPGVTAIYATKMSTDPVNKAMLDLGIGPAPVSRDIRNVPLTDQQFDDFARIAGRSTKMRLDAIVRSPDYQSWPKATQHEVIEETLRQSREAARGWMMMKYPEIAKEAAQRQISRKTGEPLPKQ